MMGKTHRLGGISTGIIIGSGLYSLSSPGAADPITVSAITLGSIVGSLIPDIDHPRSTISKRMPILSKIATSIFKHRGMTHTLLLMCLSSYFGVLVVGFLPVVAQKIAMAYVVGYFFGYGNHLFLDSLTPAGVPLLYPFIRKPIRIAKIPSGEHEGLVSFGIIIFTVIIVYSLFTFGRFSPL